MQPLVPYGTTYQEVAYGGRTKDEADNHPRGVISSGKKYINRF